MEADATPSSVDSKREAKRLSAKKLSDDHAREKAARKAGAKAERRVQQAKGLRRRIARMKSDLKVQAETIRLLELEATALETKASG